MKKVDKLTSWDFYDTKEVYEGYERKTVPEATPKNMVILMNKINELTKIVNKLSKN